LLPALSLKHARPRPGEFSIKTSGEGGGSEPELSSANLTRVMNIVGIKPFLAAIRA
jgi:hypothetical protein